MANNTSVADQTAADMIAARKRTEFDVPKLRDFVYGTSEEWRIRQRVAEVLSRDDAFDKTARLYMTRTQRYVNGHKMIHRLRELQDEHGWSIQEIRQGMSLLDDPSPIFLHLVAFEPVMQSQASPELLAKYGDLIAKHGIYGCYLQTELGHGSNVAGLETTATYIPESREFEIHSPSLTSSKWWIGAAAKTSTHGVVQAQLILPGGKNMGPHLFFVQLRSLDDHTAVPGITLGDIGPKAMNGNAPNDNGFVRFNQVRIPAEHMLSKFAQVTADGRYVQPPHAKLSYGGMLYIRASMTTSGGWWLARASTIAIRYATVRRQGNKDTDGLEKQIITYPSVYYRLLPILARAYAFLLLGRNLEKTFSAMMRDLAQGDTSFLAEMHATTSGLKVLVTTACARDIETARRALGGHGYSAFAGLGRVYADYLPAATYEGDNFVLDLQVVRATVKAFKRVNSAAENGQLDTNSIALTPTTAYLHHLLPGAEKSGMTSLSWQDVHSCVELLERRAIAVVRERAQHEHDADASADQRVSRAVTEAFVAEQVEKFISALQSDLGGREAAVLSDVLQLYILTVVEDALVDLLTYDILPTTPPPGIPSAEQGFIVRELRKEVQRLCLKLLPQSIGLTDAFGFSDWELDSALGGYDGRVYEALWEKAQTEPLNRTDVPLGYQEYIRPVLLRGQRLAAQEAAKTASTKSKL